MSHVAHLQFLLVLTIRDLAALLPDAVVFFDKLTSYVAQPAFLLRLFPHDGGALLRLNRQAGEF